MYASHFFIKPPIYEYKSIRYIFLARKLVYTNNLCLQELFFKFLQILENHSTIPRSEPFKIGFFIISQEGDEHKLENGSVLF